ncbi:MAG: hypothetical protein U0Y10_00730 [Spirosomataceae bacterium]
MPNASVRKIASVSVRPKVTRDQIILEVDRILKLNGCLACGLGGYDIRIGLEEIINPDQFKIERDFLRNVVVAEHVAAAQIAEVATAKF